MACGPAVLSTLNGAEESKARNSYMKYFNVFCDLRI